MLLLGAAGESVAVEREREEDWRRKSSAGEQREDANGAYLESHCSAC